MGIGLDVATRVPLGVIWGGGEVTTGCTLDIERHSSVKSKKLIRWRLFLPCCSGMEYGLSVVVLLLLMTLIFANCALNIHPEKWPVVTKVMSPTDQQ